MQGRKKAKQRFTIALIANAAGGKESAIVDILKVSVSKLPVKYFSHAIVKSVSELTAIRWVAKACDSVKKETSYNEMLYKVRNYRVQLLCCSSDV